LRNRYLSPEALSFNIPQVPGGLHQVVVSNAPDNVSVAMGLMIETNPEIVQVLIGNQYVNYYELVIVGRNFQQNSSLNVDGQKIGGFGGQDLGNRENLVYVDCNKLIYERHPYSQVDKDFRIIVNNPGGESSQIVTITAP